MNVLVSGGGGYIGAVLCRKLVDRGHQPVALDRFYWGREPLAELGIESIAGDLRDMKNEWLDGIDAVCHLGGLSNDPTAEYNTEANWQMNVVATEELVRLCKERGIQRFTFASSASIYDAEYVGDVEQLPQMCDEQTAVYPRGAYSLSKRAAEEAIIAAVDDTFAPVIFRQGTAYGYSPRMRLDLVVNTFLKDAIVNRVLYLHGGGWMWRPLVSVDDVAAAHILALESPLDAIGGQIFNLVQENYQIRQLAMLVSGSLRMRNPSLTVEMIEKPQPTPNLVRNYRMSGAKSSNILGFTPSVTVLKAIDEMIGKLASPEELANPRYYNIRWMSLLEECLSSQMAFGSIY
jgi:nucleoside-diphosphate-sugar epimerase